MWIHGRGIPFSILCFCILVIFLVVKMCVALRTLTCLSLPGFKPQPPPLRYQTITRDAFQMRLLCLLGGNVIKANRHPISKMLPPIFVLGVWDLLRFGGICIYIMSCFRATTPAQMQAANKAISKLSAKFRCMESSTRGIVLILQKPWQHMPVILALAG